MTAVLELDTCIDTLQSALTIVGQIGPIMVNIGVIKHHTGHDSKKDMVKIGKECQPITLKDFVKFLKKVNKKAEEVANIPNPDDECRTFTFIYEGIHYNKKNGYYIFWGT